MSCFDPGNPALNYSTQYCRWHCSSSWCCFRWSSTGCSYFEYLAPFQAFRWPTRSDKILTCLVAPMFVGCWTKSWNTSQSSFQGVSSWWAQSATFFSYTFRILSWRSRWRDIYHHPRGDYYYFLCSQWWLWIIFKRDFTDPFEYRGVHYVCLFSPYEILLPLATWESTFFWFSRGATLVFFGMPFQIVRVGAKLCCLLRCSEPVPYHNQYWTVSATTYKIHPCFPIHVSSPGAGIQFLSSVERGIVSIYFL